MTNEQDDRRQVPDDETPATDAGDAPGGLDEQLQREIDAALGDGSIDDLMQAELSAETGGPDTGGDPLRGTVVAIHGDDVFVDVGGRAEGVLRTDQFRDEPLPEPGETVEVTVVGRDGDDGLLRLSRKGAVQAAAWETLEVGQVVEGVVTGHNKGGLELKINSLRAFMPVSQIERFRVEDLGPYVNQKLQCMVTEFDRQARNLIVSRRDLLEAEAEESRRELWQTLAEGQTVPGTVRSLMPYGAFVDLGGVDGLLHISDMSHGHVDKPGDIVAEGQQVEVRVLSIDRDNERIALGLKQTMADPWDGVEHKWPVDQVVTGRVTRVMDFGAFCELEEGVEGLIPISELTFERRVGHPSEIVAVGDMVKVRVLKVEPDRRRISLSIKRVGDDPWMGASVRWAKGAIVDGIVTRLAEFGAFVELARGVEGLVHISELADEHTRNVGDVVAEGQPVQVKVLDVDENRRRIGLSLKQAGAAPSAAPVEPRPATPRKRPLKGGLD
ncbi:MAG: S1 RNA-binding domain-containing protein [Phycisphaerae bacterium]|nr:S1 RNA-binding domain-containing protein [Phycisphaerae bacterium]